MKIKAYCKINLSLDITSKRDDGYHEIDTVMQGVSLYDEIDITKNKTGEIVLSTVKMHLPSNEKNTAYRAAKVFLDYFNIHDMGVNIHIIKEVPAEAGLGGGSADAAAVLHGMNDLFDTNASEEELVNLALQVGADVPFCLFGGTKRCRGIGEIMETLPSLPPCYIVILKPEIGISTQEAYEASDKYPQTYFQTDSLVEALCNNDIEEIAQNISNRFDDIMHIPNIQIAKSLLIDNGAINAMMTGSGSAVYGIFKDEESANKSKELLKSLGKIFVCTPWEY